MLSWLSEVLHRRSKKPWARFIVSGIHDDGQVRFEMAWNKAFIKNIKRHGFEAESEEISVQQFLVGAFIIPTGLLDEEVTSTAHPNLRSDKNHLDR